MPPGIAGEGAMPRVRMAPLGVVQVQATPPLADDPAGVVPFQAAGLAEVVGDDRDFVLAADRLAAGHAQPRVRQGVQPLGRDLGPAPRTEPLWDGHSPASSLGVDCPTASIPNTLLA